MEKQLAGKWFYRLNTQINLHSYDNAAEILANINKNLYPAFCISTSKEYNPTYTQDTVFSFILNAINNQNANLQKEAENFLNRWSYIISSISPLDFFSNIQGLFSKNQNHSNLFYVFLPALNHAISLMSDDEILHNFPFIQKIFHIISQTKQNEIPTSIWQIIGKYSIEEEITQLLDRNLDVSFASISSFLIQKNPKKFSNFLFKNASSDYLNEFLKNCNQNYKIDIDEGINRVENDCTKIGVAGFNSTCLLLANILHFYEFDLTEEQKTKIKSILERMFSFLENEKISDNDKNSILLNLYEGTKRNLFDKNALKKLLMSIQFSNDFIQLKITCLKIAILCIDSSSNEDYQRFFDFSPDEDLIYIQYLEIFGDNFSFLKEKSQKLVIHLLRSIFHPLSLEPNVAVSIVKLLLKLDPNEVLNFDVDSNLDFLFESYLAIQNSELTNLTIKLAKLYKYSPPLTKIDLFGKFNEKLISILPSLDHRLIKELVDSQFLDASNRYCLLEAMQHKPNYYTEFIVSIISIIYSFSQAIGIKNDIDSSLWKMKMKKPEICEKIISNDEIKEMFEKINGPIEKSEFGTFLGAALDTLAILATNDYNWSKIHHSEIAKTALISSHFIQICPKQVLNLLTRLQTFRTSKKENNSDSDCYKEAFRIVESVHIPMCLSIEVVLYSKACYCSYDETVKRFPKYVNEALGNSRMICDMFRNEIKQPLQPMNTFLSFVGIKEHEEWVDICQNVIPPHEWKIRLNDEKIVDNMKNLDEKTIIILQQRFNTIKNKPKPVTQIKESFSNLSSSFSLKESIHIVSGLKIHSKDNKSIKPGDYELSQLHNYNQPNEQENKEIDETNSTNGTLFDVISFLWHSKLDLPEFIKPEDLENLALENNNNPQILIGFFSWSNVHNYKINLEKWKEKINIEVFNDLWLFAVAMFASNIHCSFSEIPSEIFNVFQKCFTSFGYPKITKTSLVNGYYHLTGVKWLIVRNIILIDPSYFNEYPLIITELTNNMDLFKKYFDELDTNNSKEVNFYSFTGINNILFKPSGDQMFYSSLIPTNRFFDSRIMSFRETSRIPTQIEIPKELLESIINCLQKAKEVSYNYFAFFMNIKMSNEQFNRVHDIFFKDRDSSDMNRKFMLPSLFVSETGKSAYLEDEAIRFYSNKPPSLTRAFFRSLLCRFAPPVNQDLIVKIESKLEAVFPDLCYCGFAKSGIKMWPNALPISKLRFGYIDNNIGSSLLNDMKIPCGESLYIYKLLSSLSDEELAIAQPWATKGMIREEISRVLLETATSDESNSFFAHEAVSLICDSIGIDNAMVLIASKDLFERPNFLCAMIAFKYLIERAKKESNQSVLNFIQVFQNPETNIIDKEDRKNIFLAINTCDSYSKLIHHLYENNEL